MNVAASLCLNPVTTALSDNAARVETIRTIGEDADRRRARERLPSMLT